MKRLALVACLSFAACTSSEQQVKNTPAAAKITAKDFYPLAIGTSWSYELKLLGATQSIDVSMLRTNEDGFTEDSTGAQFLADSFGVRDQKRYLLRNPIEIGTNWTNVVSVSSVEHYEIIGANQACDAPAGQWNDCVVVESRNRVSEGTTLVNEMTFAPGVGIVRLSTVLESKGQQIPQSSLALLKFTPPPTK